MGCNSTTGDTPRNRVSGLSEQSAVDSRQAAHPRWSADPSRTIVTRGHRARGPDRLAEFGHCDTGAVPGDLVAGLQARRRSGRLTRAAGARPFRDPARTAQAVTVLTVVVGSGPETGRRS